jgi:uncharacterized protein involved in exopolysaccharide biosynthesis
MTAVRPPDSTSAASLLLGWLGAALAVTAKTGRRGVIWSLVSLAAGVGIALILPAQFTSSATFIAQGSSASLLPTALQGIAASVGLANAKDYSPQFYADLLASRPVLVAALSRAYQVPGANGMVSRTYFDIESISGRDSATRLDNALRYFGRRVSAHADVRTNVVTLDVTARYATLSRDLAQALLSALDSMNISFRQEQSRELREFFATRVTEAQSELDSAEGALRTFLERNRAVQSSPLLQFEQLRLSRTADLKRTVYTTVLQQYEEAKLQEARNVPVLTILANPVPPTKKSGPPRRFIAALGLLVGILIAVGLDYMPLLRSQLWPTDRRAA